MNNLSSQFSMSPQATQLRKALFVLLILMLLPIESFAERRQRNPPSQRDSGPRSSQRQHEKKKEQNRTQYRVQLTKIRAIDASNQAPGGETGAEQIRVSPADYPDDGSGTTILSDEDRANARTISNTIVQQSADLPNNRGMSNMIWAWGQFIDHDVDLTLTDVANGTANIEIENENDPLGPNPIFFDRSGFASGSGTAGNPRTQINAITSFLDASNVYGSDEVRATVLREFEGGRLRVSADGLPPINDVGLPNAGPRSGFLVGDVRGNENVVLTSLHTLFLREHNRLCYLISIMDSQADDEQIYQLARKIVQAEIQSITFDEFLPALLGQQAQPVAVISPSDPAIATEFATACYRFGHSTLSSNIELVDATGTGTISLASAFFNPDFLIDDPLNVDRLLAGLPTEPCQEIDMKVVSELQTFLFGPGAGGFDLAALNIQRGRDHGISDYNSMREAYGLTRVSDFAEITSDAALQASLEELYGTVDNIDAWVGGLAEDHVLGGSTGALVRAVILDQFSRFRSADEFYHENDRDLRTPIVEAVIDLQEHSLYATILANTTVRQFSESPFFTGPPTDSDIHVAYNSKNDRIHITGNRENNSVVLTDSGLGITVIAGAGSLVNGKRTLTLPASKKPHMTIDLGRGDDSVILIGLDLKDVVVVLGEENEQFTSLFTKTQSLVTDVETGSAAHLARSPDEDDKEEVSDSDFVPGAADVKSPVHLSGISS